ncbi:putative lipase C4A8.10 isoform X1 [Gossypium raimondii]|uniref:putative lipase C4A8.10 isoform X1 n=1 Tax=Gossypium raimondii TaxID=29730 RepID=UPI00227D4914|nr:putative lipase C4A8.10 isoform X1 [Gossypium raimondii]
MAEIEGNSKEVGEKEVDAKEVNHENENNNNNTMGIKKLRHKSTKKERRSLSFARFGCLRVESDETGGVDMEVRFPEKLNHPSHLVIMVNGLIGSAQDWKFAAKHFLKKYPEDVIVHCSKRNSSIFTFDGVDVMGDRLAEEVKYVISRHPSVQKISFVGHSLGGLIARYAIARLFEQDLTQENSQTNGDSRADQLEDSWLEGNVKCKMAGLEPVNFITLASPHLGSRWHKQVPLFRGSHVLEKAATRTSWFLGRTGKHLFLTDGKDGKPPLLLQMASDCEDLKFISALLSFKRRVVYANASFDHIVGWSTSSLRRRDELPKYQIKHLPRGDKYPHVVNVETGKTPTLDVVPYEAQIKGTEKIDMEEEMIRALTKMSWERVDVYFKGSRQRLLAHLAIQASLLFTNALFFVDVLNACNPFHPPFYFIIIFFR